MAGNPIKIGNFVHQDIIFKSYVDNEDKTKTIWNSRWGWMLDEYKEMQKKTRLQATITTHESDTRTILPVPESVNHEYGWISIMPEFILEKYGPDVDRGLPLPKELYIPKQ